MAERGLSLGDHDQVRPRQAAASQEPDRFIPAMRERAGIDLLPIGEAEACQIHKLPPLHRDPFDRILVAQAACHGLAIVTDDAWIGRYPVRTLW